MIGPSDRIQKLINEQNKSLDDTHSRLSEIWVNDILFSFGWGTLLFHFHSFLSFIL